ncbi:zinc-dependent metalloprotease [Psychroflexus sediminis]|uniref:Por secretion system C-terminal sorting domain-containing protein n=1 Tax=Psychroflexus sediminis TaxID=470826 RepID=A0A1G7XYI5_9FLAO|nr:zinc-dependent metalloprotease family protein [Psychroflexus sediminis]SDG89282.1 Por secretion system C-terminal sorting domain-containing protein [Psychroflexus sediminis]
MMSSYNSRIIISLVSFFFFANSGFSQNRSSFWTQVDKNNLKKVQFNRSIPEKSSYLILDAKRLEEFLATVPGRSESKTSSKIISFPNAEGVLESFRVMEASVMTPELQEKFPGIRSYTGRGVNNPSSSIRFSMSKEKGLSSMLLSGEETVFIEPYQLMDNVYISYINSAGDKPKEDFECLTEYIPLKNLMSNEEFKALKNANDGKLRTYRLALASTVEYAQFHGGTLADVMAAMNSTMTRVNGVFERDLGLTMVLVANNEDVIFLGPDTNSDPYTNEDTFAMLSENQTVCDTNIGSANYDIGHVFGTGGGGVATLGSPCTNSKARGVSGSSFPTGDTFDIDIVAHEMGHQYGGNHTQNNDCNRSTVSVEPGSGSTIMSYAGICPPNVQVNSDDYFHGENIKEMWLNISLGNSSNCPSITTTGNTAPVAKAGSDYFIPKSTPFILRGSGSDPDNSDVLTYVWEQIDRTPAPMPPQSTSTSGPLFRSIPPTTSPNRYMPSFSTVLSGSLSSTWEVVPSVAREMNFLLTVRDNSMPAGNSNSEEVTITSVDTTPFVVLTPPTWPSGSTQTLNWIVGESNISPINCKAVNIYFSEDGIDFSTPLALGVANTGSVVVTLPSIANTSTARILIEAADHIFYSVTDAFAVGTSSDFTINSLTPEKSVCNLDTASYEFDFKTSNGFSETTEFSVSGPNPINYSFTPSNLDANGSFSLNLTNLLDLNPGDYTLEITGTSTSITKTTSVKLTIKTGGCESIANTNYETSTTGVMINDAGTTILSNLNTGKPAGYSDFTNIVTDVIVNSPYELSINVNTDGQFQTKTYVWIDWNKNCSFDDPGEQYDLGSAFDLSNQPTANSPVIFTVPTDAVLGNTTMRVTTKYIPSNSSDFPKACENGFDGEVEDYTLNVLSTLSSDSFSFQNLSIYPNPSQAVFNIQFATEKSAKIQLSLFDLRGRFLLRNEYDVYGDFRKELDLSQFASGVFLLKLSDGYRSITKKIIVE